jgi:very-short-patch-repair endonuclease
VLGLVEGRPEHLEVVVRRGTRSGDLRAASVRRVAHLDIRDVRTVKGLRVTCPARTLVDLAGALTDRALARAVDTALLSGLTTIRVIRRYVHDRRLQRRPGIRRLVKLLDDREFGVPESELERRMLELIGQYRLPSPERQRAAGPHRVDFAYLEAAVLVEVDGRATHGTAEAFDQDPVRQNDLVLEGWTVLRFTWTHITADPDYVAETITRALE